MKAVVYLAQAAMGETSAETTTFDAVGPMVEGREGLPRVAYVGQIFSRQRSPEIDEKVIYGANTNGMMPLLLHPDEWLDGAIVPSYTLSLGGAETYFYQNHPVITDLYRRHEAGELSFVGTVATIAGSDNEDRDRNCQAAANLAKWSLKPDAAVLTKFGGGVPHSDMAITANLLEGAGIRTAVMVSDMAKDRRIESALLFNFPDVDAIVYCGGVDTIWKVPRAERVVAGHPDLTEALAMSQEIGAASIVGILNQQGATRLRAVIY
jgi:glycine reductase